MVQPLNKEAMKKSKSPADDKRDVLRLLRDSENLKSTKTTTHFLAGMKLADRVFLILIIVVNARPAYDENKRLAASFS